MWWVIRANNQRITGNIAEALTLYLETIERYPEWYFVYYEISWGYKLINQTDEAIKFIEKAISLNNRRDSYYLRAGLIYEWAGMSEEAIESYIQASTLAPLNGEYRKAIERLSSPDA